MKGFKASKLMQEKKQFNQNFFKDNNCVIFITLLDKIGVIKKCSNKFHKMFGFPIEEVIN